MFFKRFETKGLAFKLSLSILSATSLLIFIILFNNYHLSKRLLVESARETAVQLSDATIQRIENVLTSVQKAPEGMAIYLRSAELNEENLNGILSLSLKNKPEIFGSCIAFAPYSFMKSREAYAPYCYRTSEGILFKNLGDDMYKYFDQNWYKSAKDKGQPIWTEPYFDKGGGNVLMTTYAVPFYSGDSPDVAFRGVVTADISLKWLEELMDSIKVFETGYAYLVSEKGTIITHPEARFQMKNLVALAEGSSNPKMADIGRRMLSEKSGYLPFNSLIDHKPCMAFYSSLPQTNWHIVVVFREKELYAGLENLLIFTILIGIIGMILISIVVILLSMQITRPLRRLSQTAIGIGAGNFDLQIREDHSTKEIAMLGNALGSMQLKLKDYIRNLEATTAVKERFESELNIAHDIQQGMIPKIFPPFPDRREIDIYALLEPARQVGGDLYDFFFLDENTLCFAVGDVSDKGVPASLMMAITITLFRAKTDINLEISEIVKSINREISKDNENLMFVTFFMGILNLRTGELIFCNAGHNYPLLLKKDGEVVMIEETHGMPLGVDEEMEYTSGKTVIEKNETLILYTDGITEALSIRGDFYGDDRFAGLVQNKCKGSTPRQITAAIMEDVAAFTLNPERSDDITLLVLSFFPEIK